MLSISAGRPQFSVRPLSLDDYPAQSEPSADPVTLSADKAYPFPIGHEFAGTIAAIGEGVEGVCHFPLVAHPIGI